MAHHLQMAGALPVAKRARTMTKKKLRVKGPEQGQATSSLGSVSPPEGGGVIEPVVGIGSVHVRPKPKQTTVLSSKKEKSKNLYKRSRNAMMMESVEEGAQGVELRRKEIIQ